MGSWREAWARVRGWAWPEEAPVQARGAAVGRPSHPWARGRARHVNKHLASVGLLEGGPRWLVPWDELVLDLEDEEGGRLALAELRRRGGDDDMVRALQLAGRMP